MIALFTLFVFCPTLSGRHVRRYRNEIVRFARRRAVFPILRVSGFLLCAMDRECGIRQAEEPTGASHWFSPLGFAPLSATDYVVLSAGGRCIVTRSCANSSLVSTSASLVRTFLLFAD